MSGRGYMPPAVRGDWNTPREVLDPLEEFWGGRPSLDPCSNATSIVGAEAEYRIERGQDGLKMPWFGKTFVNPPFDRLQAWAERAALFGKHWARDREIVLLMPARVDTRAWHNAVPTADAICLWKGRLRFLGAEASAPFPVALIYWGDALPQFRRVFGQKGMVLTIHQRGEVNGNS